MLASTLVGGHLQLYPDMIEAYNKKWIDGKDIWLARTAILFQLKYKDKTDVARLFANCEKWLDSDEFFYSKSHWLGATTICKI